jgi:hypothetical protein
MTPVRQRLVFFIGGFDPKGASSFYQQHKASFADHSARHSIAYEFSPRTKSQAYCSSWTVLSIPPNCRVTTQFNYLAWDDIVRAQWARTTGTIVGQACGCLKDFVLTGTIQRLYVISKNVVLAAMFPYALVLGALACVMMATAVTAALAMHWKAPGGLVWWLAGTIGVASSWIAFKWLQSVPSTWFLRVVAFARRYATASHPVAPEQQRLAIWSQHIQMQIQSSNADEVLLIGFSAGSILGMALMARCVREDSKLAKKISLLTLGNCIPAAAALPDAHHVRADLHTLGQAQTRWVDITSPIDWGSFAQSDDVVLLAGGQASLQRQYFSPQWHLLFTKSHYQLLKKDKYRVHKQYLQTTDLLGRYDYFAITCGPQSLDQRFLSTS